MARPKNTAPGGAAHTITDVLKITTGTFECWALGLSPLIENRMSEKVQRELLLPRGRLTETDKITRLKHDPISEFRASPYTLKDTKQPTLLAMLATAFKKALMTAALDMPGARKAQIGRLTWIEGELIGIYGTPKLFMRPVRSADMNRTPDVRTRAIVPEWAACLQVTFVQPLINAQSVANLLAAAGITVGVGDWRPEKGAGNYGQFRIVDKNDPELRRVMAAGGRAAQQHALDHPVCYDDESTELLSWYHSELADRQKKGMSRHVDSTNGSADRRDQVAGKRTRTNHTGARPPRRARPSQSLAQPV
jgi:hypothetical protein